METELWCALSAGVCDGLRLTKTKCPPICQTVTMEPKSQSLTKRSGIRSLTPSTIHILAFPAIRAKTVPTIHSIANVLSLVVCLDMWSKMFCLEYDCNGLTSGRSLLTRGVGLDSAMTERTNGLRLWAKWTQLCVITGGQKRSTMRS